MCMKRVMFILLLGLGCSIYMSAKNLINIDGKDYTVDTLTYKHQVGPGTTYAKYDLPELPLKVYVLEMDLTNPYINFETCKGGDKGVAIECPSSMYARNDRPGHDMVAATNGDFYFYQDPIEIGIPRSGQYRNNECVTNPVGRAAFVLSADRKPYIDRVDFAGKLTYGNNTTRIHAVNMQRLEWEDTGSDFMLLYTNSYGPKTENRTGGTKVVIKPKSGTFFFSANKNIEAVVEEIYDNTEGVTDIPEGKALLWGRGDSETFLKTLSVGAEITIFLGTNLRAQPGLLTDFKELMGGSNHIIMRNGILEDPIDDRQPRTGIGFSSDSTKVYYVVFDGRTVGSVGASMKECGAIFKAIGAWNAVNLDGGGSSCMVVNNEIVNKNSDGVERAVGNGCLLFSNAPVDDVISKLGFAPRSYNIPVMAKFRPVIYGYNKYGLLKNKDVEGIKLTCDPSIGRINENGEFIAASTPGAGKITATYNGESVSQDVMLMPADINLRLTSVLIDNIFKYEIEVYGSNGVYKDNLDPASLTWSSSDTEICTVDNGVLKGLKNGEATIECSGNGASGSMKVVVEISPDRILPVDPDMDVSTWKISQIGGTDRVVTPLENGMKITYKGSSGRGYSIKLAKKIKLWSLPDTIRLRINPGEVPITGITICTAPNGGGIVNSRVEVPEANKMNVIDLPTDKWCDAKDISNYPIYFNYIQFDMSAPVKGKEYTIEIPGIEAVYKGVVGGVEEILKSDKEKAVIYPNPVSPGDNVYVSVPVEDEVDVAVYNNAGQLLSKFSALPEGNKIQLPVSNLAGGIYFITVSGAGYSGSVQLIVK